MFRHFISPSWSMLLSLVCVGSRGLQLLFFYVFYLLMHRLFLDCDANTTFLDLVASKTNVILF